MFSKLPSVTRLLVARLVGAERTGMVRRRVVSKEKVAFILMVVMIESISSSVR